MPNKNEQPILHEFERFLSMYNDDFPTPQLKQAAKEAFFAGAVELFKLITKCENDKKLYDTAIDELQLFCVMQEIHYAELERKSKNV